MEEIEKDKRFSHITKDVRFKKIPRKEKKVKIDKRFQSMFTDEKFQLKSVVDKRGRPYISKGSEHLQRYYDYSESDDSDNEEPEEVDEERSGESDTTKTQPKKEKANDSEVPENIISSTKISRKELAPEVKAKLRDLVVDYARGEGIIESESSSDEESTSEEEEEELDHDWGEMDREASTTDESTKRLALCNMDWDRITAQDIMVLVHSFLQPGGVLRSVAIYPSEFGLKRIKDEEEKGPTELTAMPETEDKEDDELSVEQREKLREYQLKRLKYYYAVLVFDSVRTADHVYKECDGLEYESSMNRLDLRFVPDDTEFDQEPREECRELPDLTSYKPRLYRTTALTQVKVDLTWDETDPARQEMIRAAHQGKFDDSKLDQFLASSSDEEEEPALPASNGTSDEPISEKKAIEKYKALLAGLTETEEKKDKDVNMEVTWDLKFEQKTSEKVKEATKSSEAATPFEKFMEKKKQKKKLKKQKKGNVEDESESEQPFSDDDIPSDIDMNDPYFKQEMEQMGRGKKSKKTQKLKDADDDDADDEQRKAELELLMLDTVKEEPKQHFSLKKIEEKEKKSTKKKFRKKKADNVPQVEDNFKMNVDDDRFSAIYSSHLYNVDPAAPNFKPTDGMKALIDAKLKRKRSEDSAGDKHVMTEKKKKDAELNLLVKSVKKKTQAVNQKKSNK